MTTHRADPVAPAEGVMTDAERSALRDHLEADIRRLRRTVAGAAAEQERRAREHEDGRGDESDISAYRSGIGQDVSLAEHAAMLLARNEHALGRLADGSYEQCENCGHQIGTQRLLALPRATLCMGCQRGCDAPTADPRDSASTQDSVSSQRLGVPGHQVGDSRLIGGRPSSAVWRRRVL